MYDGWRVGKVEENGRVLVFVDDDRITNLIVRPFPIVAIILSKLCLNYLCTFRRSSGAGSGAGGGGSVGGGGSRRGSAQHPIAVIEDQRSTGAGSDCEAPESGSSNVLRITEYVTSRTLASCRTGNNNRQISSYEDDENDGDGEAGDDELENGDAADSGETSRQQQQIRPGRRFGHLSGGSGHGSIKPRTSDYESSDSPNSSDHCEELSVPSSRTCTALEEPELQQQPPVVIRTEIEDLDCPHAISYSGIDADDEDYLGDRVKEICKIIISVKKNSHGWKLSLIAFTVFPLKSYLSDSFFFYFILRRREG